MTELDLAADPVADARAALEGGASVAFVIRTFGRAAYQQRRLAALRRVLHEADPAATDRELGPFLAALGRETAA